MENDKKYLSIKKRFGQISHCFLLWLFQYNQLLQTGEFMAFVFGKTQKKSVFQSRKIIPGPGQYNEPSRYLNQHSAPFNSSSFKQTQFDIAPTNTGPGSYDPVYSKSSYTDKKLRMTSSFNSKVQRFKTQNIEKVEQKSVSMKVAFEESDQPRKYKSNNHKQTFQEAVERTKSRMSAIQDANKQRKINSIGVNKQFVRIILSNPHNTEMNHSVIIDSSIIKKQNGPGSYNIENATDALHNKNMHVVDWSKNTIKRFKTQKNKNPGPGQYQVLKNPNRSVSSSTAAFAYQGLRSHMDQIIYKTKMPFKVKVIEERHLKDRYPGPGQYEPKLTVSKSFHYGEEAFGSVETEEHRRIGPTVPGPGYYQINSSNSNNIKEDIKKTREKIFGKSKIKMEKVSTLQQNHKQQIRKKCVRDMENEGKYYSLEERCTSKIGNFAQSERFKGHIKTQKVVVPGPGQYKIQSRNEQSFQKGIQYAFNSTSDRLEQLQNAQKIPFYDLDRNDMGKKALRIKKNIQNLKQIDIEKAPFNSKQKRFSSQTYRQNNQQDLEMNWNPIQNETKAQKLHKSDHRTEYETLAKKITVSKPQHSVFKSKTKRNWLATTNDLGPGNYNYTTTLEKKSFNQQYHYKPPLKIRSTYKTRSSLA